MDSREVDSFRDKFNKFQQESDEIYKAYYRRRKVRQIGALAVAVLNLAICICLLTGRVDVLNGLLMQLACLGLTMWSVNMETGDQNETAKKIIAVAEKYK